MHHFFEAITNRSGDSMIGYFGRVIDPATLATVTIASDNNGTPIFTVSGVENMAKTDENGNISLYVVPGTYHLDIYQPDATTFIMRVPNVAMNSSKGDPGPEGPPGLPENTYTTYAALLASDPSRKVARLVPQVGETEPAGSFNYINGAWVRQQADGISYRPAVGAPLRSQADKNSDAIALHELRSPSDTNDLNAWNIARTLGRPIRFVAGKGSGPGGVYLLNFAPLQSNLEVFGDGAGTVIRPTVYANGNCFLGNSGAADTFIDNVTIRDLTIQGYQGFLEPEHLIRASGFRNLKINNVRFIGWRGDAIYIGSGEVAGQQRFNRGIYITNCYFDGVDSDNRNGISVIDGNDVVIDKCEFYRVSRSNMPGPIDFEPDGQPYHTLNSLTVTSCSFRSCGGNLGQIAFLFPSTVALPKGIYIAGNKFKDYVGIGADIAIDMRRPISASDYPMQVIIDGNSGFNGNRPIDILCGIDVTVTPSNVFYNYKGGNLIGFTGVENIVRDIRFDGNYTLCGTQTTAGTILNRATNVEIGATFDRCGMTGSGGYAFQFGATSSSKITLRNMKVIPNTGQTVAINSSGHTFDQPTNKMLNVDVGGLVNQFLAQTEGRITFTYEGGWADAADAQQPTRIYENGEGRVFASVNLSGGTLTNGTVAFRAPAGKRPEIRQVIMLRSGTSFAILRLDTDGAGVILGSAPTASLQGSFSYNIGK